MISRMEAKHLMYTNPYPETRNGLKKVREEVWINGLYGLPTEADARHQLGKNLSDYQMDIRGFYCSGGIHSGVFCETDPENGYGPKHVCWKYYIHYAVYRDGR